MAQHLTDLAQRRASSEHLRRETMPEEVRPAHGGMEPGPSEGTTDDRRDRSRPRERTARSPHAKKHTAHGARRTIATEIAGHRLPDVCQQGEAIVPEPFFSADGDRAPSPVNVIELKCDHFPGAQPQTSEEEQDGTIATARRRLAVAGGEEPLDLVGGERFRNRGQPPVGHGEDGPGQVDADLAALKQEAQQRPEGRDHQLRPPGAPCTGMPSHERGDIGRAQCLDRRHGLAQLLGQKLAKVREVGLYRRRTQPSLGSQILLVAALKLRQWGLIDHTRRRDDSALCAKVSEQSAECRRAAPLPTTSRPRLVEKRANDALIEIRNRDVVAGHPAIERAKQLPLRADRRWRVPQSDQILGE